jgi:hypothetical protein
MSDVAISSVGLPEYRMTGQMTPAYHLTFNDHKLPHFIITRIVEWGHQTVKVVGCYYSGDAGCQTIDIGTAADIVNHYEEFLKTRMPNQFVEMIFPYVSITSCRSLMYRHKVVEKKSL